MGLGNLFGLDANLGSQDRRLAIRLCGVHLVEGSTLTVSQLSIVFYLVRRNDILHDLADEKALLLHLCSHLDGVEEWGGLSLEIHILVGEL
jgi:hypothetical protein